MYFFNPYYWWPEQAVQTVKIEPQHQMDSSPEVKVEEKEKIQLKIEELKKEPEDEFLLKFREELSRRSNSTRMKEWTE